MAKTLQLRRYDTNTLDSITGAEGELIVDTTAKTVTVHDGSTAGGIRLARENSNLFDQSLNTTDNVTFQSVTTAKIIPYTEPRWYSGASYTYGDIQSGISFYNVNQATTDFFNALVAGDKFSVFATDNTWYTFTFISSSVGMGGPFVTVQENLGKFLQFVDGTGIRKIIPKSLSTGDFTFSANTISLPDFTSGSLNVVGFETRMIPNLLGTANLYTSSGVGYNFPADKHDTELNGIVWNVPSGYNFDLVLTENASASMITSVAHWQIGDTFDVIYINSQTGPSDFTLNKVTVTLTSNPTPLTGYQDAAFRFTVDKLIPSDFYASYIGIDNYPYKKNSSYEFKSSGEFIADSALVGDVLISNDIVTPLTYDSYGVATPGTLTVNGNLDVMGTITGGKFNVFQSTTNTTEKYKTYLQGQVATTFTLPSNGEVGDWVQVICGNMSVTVPTGTYLTGYVSGSAGQTVSLGTIQKINLFVCEDVAGGTSFWRVYGLSQTPYTP